MQKWLAEGVLEEAQRQRAMMVDGISDNGGLRPSNNLNNMMADAISDSGGASPSSRGDSEPLRAQSTSTGPRANPTTTGQGKPGTPVDAVGTPKGGTAMSTPRGGSARGAPQSAVGTPGSATGTPDNGAAPSSSTQGSHLSTLGAPNVGTPKAMPPVSHSNSRPNSGEEGVLRSLQQIRDLVEASRGEISALALKVEELEKRIPPAAGARKA